MSRHRARGRGQARSPEAPKGRSSRGVIFIGVDLSGPSNHKETAIVWFRASGAGLAYEGSRLGADDRYLFELVSGLASTSSVTVGLDAPLSYNVRGGDRERDRALRALLVARGLSPGTVMAPTMTRMAYLTLRGMAVARALETLRPKRRAPRIVEVHPIGCLALRGAPVFLLQRLKKSRHARQGLLVFLEGQGLEGAGRLGSGSPHLLAACACALAVWRWACGDAVWTFRAEPPYHPYDLAC